MRYLPATIFALGAVGAVLTDLSGAAAFMLGVAAIAAMFLAAED